MNSLLIKKIEKIENRLDKIEIVLEDINAHISKLNSSCQNMDDHIDFVESVYNRFKAPFSIFLPARIKNNLYIKK